jgi:hypothetical protein
MLMSMGALALVLASCGGFPGVEADRRGSLEVWNRTEAPIRIVGKDATLEVPACGHESRPNFVLNRFQVRSAAGDFITQLGGGLVMFRAGIVESYTLLSPPPDPLPPCEGLVHGQEAPGSGTAP